MYRTAQLVKLSTFTTDQREDVALALRLSAPAGESGAAAPAGHIAPMLRRRLSALGRAAGGVTAPEALADPSVALVFSSRYGDLEEALAQLKSLAAGEALSPTKFATSVHNGISGLLEIAGKHTGFSTAVAGGDAPFTRGLAQAISLLNDFPRVHLTVYERTLATGHIVAAGLMLERPDFTPDAAGAERFRRGPLLSVYTGAPKKGFREAREIASEGDIGLALSWLMTEDADLTLAMPGGVAVITKDRTLCVADMGEVRS